MKACTKCGEVKAATEFQSDAQKRTGLSSRCKACLSLGQKERLKQRPGKSTRYVKAWRQRNPEKYAEASAASDKKRERDRLRYATDEKRKASVDRRSRECAQRNPDREWAKTLRRRTALLKRNVAWADPAKIKALYVEAKRIERETGIPHQVDHIVPLRGATVSGLHWEGNLQVLPRLDNIRKSNKFEGEQHGKR